MKKLFIIPILTVLLTGFFTNCDMPKTDVIVSQDFMTHVAQVSFVNDVSNVAAGKLNTDLDNTTVKITGPDAAKVWNIEGKKVFTIQGGTLQLLLDPSVEFITDSKTYTVNLIVEATGYLKRNVPITFVKDINNAFVEVAMVKKATLPAGIRLATDTSGNVSDLTGLNKVINIVASNTLTNGVTTEITVPLGVKMRDADGNPLSGALNTEVISFSEGNDGTAYFPGGLTPDNVKMLDGTTASGAFVSAGFAAINMTIGGKNVRTFEGGKVAVKMTLSKTNFNPETSQAYKAGDNLDIWSYEDDNGQWKLESTGKVKADTDGSLYVSFETSHLSYFNLDYFGSSSRCDLAKIKLKWNGATTPVNCRLTTRYTYYPYTWYQSIHSSETQIQDGTEEMFLNAPTNMPIEIEIFDIDNNRLLVKKIFAKGDLCKGGTIDITAPVIKKQLVSLTYKGMCSNTIIYPPVGTRVYYREVGGAWKLFHYVYYANRFDNKIVTDKLKVGQTYDFMVFAGNKSQLRTITIAKADNNIEVTLSDALCKALLKG
ncbi:hypothetical protein [Flavobacterium psychrotolerans]|uniref:Uncharacterized protein n=1 Tax=Flavobacterium psychrotolerans TaxID=2169410 RepID=A0A2U1JPJ6_9FLAO|nr:hypothetical protein [Flavobacterium psychrotolerans]PWA06925.1 hypothetical protein DB895_02795 [Flavobacterium psychrotolerans]